MCCIEILRSGYEVIRERGDEETMTKGLRDQELRDWPDGEFIQREV